MSALNSVGENCYNFLVSLPFKKTNTICLTAVGVVASAVSIVTLGAYPKVNNIADFASASWKILPNLYMGTVEIIHPGFIFDENHRCGIITSKIAKPIFDKAVKSADPINNYSFDIGNIWFRTHVISRAAFFLGTILATITRTADLALGLVAATLSLVPCFGRTGHIYNFARRQLTSLGIINDICAGLRGIVNPKQFKKVVKASA